MAFGVSLNCFIAGFPLMHFGCRWQDFDQRELEKHTEPQILAPDQ